MQSAFLVLTLIGVVFLSNAIFDDTFDPRAMKLGRLGAGSLVVGAGGLLAYAFGVLS